MPRVREIIGEVGTTYTYERVNVTRGVERALVDAVNFEHPNCEDPSCDIAVSLDAGFPFVAAALLEGATETPLLCAVMDFFDITSKYLHEVPQWEEWTEYHRLHGFRCDACGTYTYEDPSSSWTPSRCGGCGAEGIVPLADRCASCGAIIEEQNPSAILRVNDDDTNPRFVCDAYCRADLIEDDDNGEEV